jgi:uncharacterized protein YbjT (DUF2867 family)
MFLVVTVHGAAAVPATCDAPRKEHAMKNSEKTTLVVGGMGSKTGRRVAERLRGKGVPVRLGSRSSSPAFDWNDENTWAGALEGVRAAYVTYHPDLAVPGAADQVRRFSSRAVESGVEQLVLLAGRGEPQVLPAEQAVIESGARYTILNCAFFAQNFSEGALAPVGDEIVFPAVPTTEPFVDTDDIADVAVEALTSERHDGRIYDLTGPRLLSFEDVARELSKAAGRTIRYVPVSFEAYAEVLAPYLPREQVDFFIGLFQELLDGHNAYLSQDVERVLGRKPRDFADYAASAWGA